MNRINYVGKLFIALTHTMNSSVTLNRLVEDFRNQPYFGKKFDLAADQQFCLTGISDLGVQL